MTKAEKLYEVGRKLPPPALAELLDFTEFLRQKNAPISSAPHMSLAGLGGGLEDSIAFAGTPVNTQQNFKLQTPCV